MYSSVSIVGEREREGTRVYIVGPELGAPHMELLASALLVTLFVAALVLALLDARKPAHFPPGAIHTNKLI